MDVLAELRASISRICEIPEDAIHADSSLEDARRRLARRCRDRDGPGDPARP